MAALTSPLRDILRETVQLWLEMGIYLVFGFAVAGALSRVLKGATIVRHLGHDTWGAVVKAALFGVPLPLCSCGVIPVGLSLYKRGASRGAATAFLITTPQTGVDSILVTYALLGPLGIAFAIVRPIAAFVNGLLGGAIVTWLDHHDRVAATRHSGGAASEPAPPPTDTFTHDTRCKSGDCSLPASSAAPLREPLWSHVRGAFLYGFWDFPREIAKWLVIGILLAAVISSVMPSDPHFIMRYLGTGLWPMLVMAAFGVLVYVCATASVPFVAVLLAHGLTPGAALVFLMTGPATNIASLVLLTKMLGKRTIAVYLLSILAVSFTFGGLLNLYFTSTGGVPPVQAMHEHMTFTFWQIFGGAALLLTILAAFARNAADALEARKDRAAMLARAAAPGRKTTALAHRPSNAQPSAGSIASARARLSSQSSSGNVAPIQGQFTTAQPGTGTGTEASVEKSAEEGAEETMGQTVSIRVEGMTCQNCARHVRQAAESVPGVESAFVDLKKNLLSVVGSAPDVATIRAAVEKAGYAPGDAV